MSAPAHFVPKLIATDIDGTMLRSDGTLSPRVRAALHAATDASIHVVPATGRPEMVAADVIEWLGLGGHWVFANGAMTRNLTTDSTIRGYWMDPVVAQGLVVEMRAAFPRASTSAGTLRWTQWLRTCPKTNGLRPRRRRAGTSRTRLST